MKVLLTATQNNFINTFAKLFKSEITFQVGTIIAEKEGIYQFIVNTKPDIIFLYGESAKEIIQEIKSNFFLSTRCVLVVPYSSKPFFSYEFQVLADAYIAESSEEEIYHNCINHLVMGKRFICPTITERLMQKTFAFEYNHIISKLGKKEYQVFRLIGYNYTIKRIAESLYISTNTVESHRNNLIKKLSISNAKELRQLASQIVYSHNHGDSIVID